MEDNNKGPETKFTARTRGGVIIATVWRNEHEERPFFNVQLERRYKKDDEWKSTTSFGVDDLPRIQLLTLKAFEYIVGIEAEAG